MSTVKRLVIVAVLVLGIPYTLIYLFKAGGDVVIGKVLAIGFFFFVVVAFLGYQIFFVPATNRKQVLDGRVSPEAIRKFDLLFRAVLLLFLVGLTYIEVIPFAVDAYNLISKDERHIIEGERYGKRGNILIDRIMANDGELYQYPYSIKRLRSSYSYFFVALPRSRLVLSAVEVESGN